MTNIVIHLVSDLFAPLKSEIKEFTISFIYINQKIIIMGKQICGGKIGHWHGVESFTYLIFFCLR